MMKIDSTQGFRLERHSPRLQSLRGIAAMCVALGHAFTIMKNGRIEDPDFTLRTTNAFLAAGEVLIQPNTAVILFYVLSGFVLGEALRRRDSMQSPFHFGAFVVRRLWRLLPAMWVSIVFAAAVAAFLRHSPYVGTTNWFNDLVGIQVTLREIVLSFFGLSNLINGVLWSVHIELAVIPLLPLAVWVSGRTSLLADFFVIAVMCTVTIFFWDRLPNFILYGYCFYLGICLPKMLTNAVSANILSNKWIVAAALLTLIPIDYLLASGRLWIVYKFILDAAICAILIAFVMLCPERRSVRHLDHYVLVWLGDVSYSFYVFAMPVLVITASVLLSVVPTEWVTNDLVATFVTLIAGITCIAISLLLAYMSFELIEKPSIALGRRWSERIEMGFLPVLLTTGRSKGLNSLKRGPRGTRKADQDTDL